MAGTRKNKRKSPKNNSTTKTARSVSGRILPPIDITNANELDELDKRISIGPITLVLVYADWCGHCTRYKPNMEQLENDSNRSVQTVRIRDDVFPKSSINKTPLEGYPSLLLIKPQNEAISFSKENGEVTPVIPEHNNMSNMKTIVSTVGTPEGMRALSNNSQQSPLSTEVLRPEGLIPVISTENKNNYFKNNLSNSTPERTKSPAGNSTIIYTPLEKSGSPSPPDLSLDRLSANMLQSEKMMVEDASNPLSQTGGPRKVTQSGGNLMNLLSRVAYQYGPAAALLYMANVKAASSKKTKKPNKTRRA